MSQHQSIYYRFFGIVLPVILVVFALTIALFEWFEHAYQVELLEKKLERITSTYSLLYAEPLAKRDSLQIKSYSLALIVDEDVAQLSLSDTNGELIESHTTGRESDTELTSTVSVSYADENGLRQVGWLTVTLSCSRIDAMMIDRLPLAALLLAILVIASLCSIIVGLFPSVHVSLKRLGEEAAYDSLTNLLNRRSFAMRVKALLKSSRGGELVSQIMFLDLDGFKQVNDQYGHRQGDLLLKAIADILKRNLRTDDAVARLGGDEFAILLKGCDEANCVAVAESIRNEIESLSHASELGFQVSASIGIVPISTNMSFEEHLEAADQACYEAKRGGKNRVCFAGELPRLCA